MTKALRKAIMTRSRLKKRSYGNWNKYKKQRNVCMELLRKTKQDYFNNIGIKSISDTKKFWKTIKSYFSSKGLTFNKILLYEKGSLIEDHASIFRIKSNLDNVSDKFDFKKVHETEAKREIMNLNSKK